jgi:hypothetical protein
MSTLVSITVTVNDGTQDHTFDVDTTKDCVLVWNAAGWDMLADYYQGVKQNPGKAQEVRDRTCPKATPKSTAALAATLVAPAPSGDAVIALKDPDCFPTEWP